MTVRLIRKNYRVVLGGPIDTVKDALQITSGLKITRREFALYRGQGAGSKMLRPGVFRRARWHRHERDMIRELISTHPQEFSADSLMLDRLVRMQHYGLPTRLLDVSQNFLAALYFATAADPEKPGDDGAVYIIRGSTNLKKYYDSDAISLVTNLSNLSEDEKWSLFENAPENATDPENDAFNTFPAMDRLLQFVRDEKPYFRSRALKSDLFKTFFVIPKKNNPRIIAQSGAFLVFGLANRDRSPDLSMFQITRHPVPHLKKGDIRAAIEALGINESSLFPEIDKAASRIAERYKAI